MVKFQDVLAVKTVHGILPDDYLHWAAPVHTSFDDLTSSWSQPHQKGLAKTGIFSIRISFKLSMVVTCMDKIMYKMLFVMACQYFSIWKLWIVLNHKFIPVLMTLSFFQMITLTYFEFVGYSVRKVKIKLVFLGCVLIQPKLNFVQLLYIWPRMWKMLFFFNEWRALPVDVLGGLTAVVGW